MHSGGGPPRGASLRAEQTAQPNVDHPIAPNSATWTNAPRANDAVRHGWSSFRYMIEWSTRAATNVPNSAYASVGGTPTTTYPVTVTRKQRTDQHVSVTLAPSA